MYMLHTHKNHLSETILVSNPYADKIKIKNKFKTANCRHFLDRCSYIKQSFLKLVEKDTSLMKNDSSKICTSLVQMFKHYQIPK